MVAGSVRWSISFSALVEMRERDTGKLNSHLTLGCAEAQKDRGCICPQRFSPSPCPAKHVRLETGVIEILCRRHHRSVEAVRCEQPPKMTQPGWSQGGLGINFKALEIIFLPVVF